MIRQTNTTEFLSVTEVARLLGYSDRRPIYKAIDAGRLHAVRLGPGGTWRIPREAWDRFVKAGTK